MRIAVSSDWHLTKKKRFTTDKKLLYEFLNWGENNLDQIVLNGDIFDLWRVKFKNIIGSKYDKRINGKIWDKIQDLRQKDKLIYIFGNHDFMLKDEYELPAEYFIPDTNIIATHGHIWDPLCLGSTKTIVKFGISLLKILEDITTANVSDIWMNAMYKLGVKNLQHPNLPEGHDFFEEARVHLLALEESGYTRLIHGHTHRAAISEDGKIMNCGCSIDKCTDFIYIENNIAQLKKMSDCFDFLK